MQVVPVIDIRGGVAVAAVRGDRARYRPLETPLAPGADPVAVAEGLQGLFPFTTLYVADLDGIERGTPDRATQTRLAVAWRGAELWIDDGSTGEQSFEAVPPPLWGRTGGGEAQDPLIKSQLRYQTMQSNVLGSESLTSLENYQAARQGAGPTAPLSLDFRGESFLGPPELLADAALWPDRIIVMTLARVGSGEGPDLARLRAVIARAEARAVFAAGGVRDIDDLKALRDIGAAGALVATALHRGSITARHLKALASS